MTASLAVAAALPVLTGLAGPAAAAQAGGDVSRDRHVDVIEVSGFVDRVIGDFVVDAIAEAVTSGAEVLVIQLDSGRSVLGDEELSDLVEAIEASPVPVGVWVGPSGAQAGPGTFPLVEAADVSGVSPGSTVVAEVGTSVVGDAPSARTDRFGAADAVADGLVDLDSPTLGDFVVDLDGRRIGGSVLETAEVVSTPDGPRREPTVAVRFAKLGALPRLLHTAASPAVAYLLLLTGLALVVFELYTGGVGVAGLTGAIALVLAGYGLAVLPVTGWGLALLVLAAIALAVDVQTGIPRFWTGVGTAALAAGSLVLYDEGVSVGWLPLVAGMGGFLLLLVSATPAVVRSRFSTPTIGREWMVGQLVTVSDAVAPDGTVVLHEARWRARANRATPLAVGDSARVVGLDGVVLEVEPLEGAARDYRERR